MSTIKLIGTDTSGTIQGSAPNQISLTRWTALSTGTVTQFKIHICQACQVKVALYADSSGSPGALLGAVNTGQQVSVGWNTLSFPDTPVTKDAVYWLAQISDISSGNYIYYNPEYGHAFAYKSQPYAGFSWPDPLTGVTVASDYYYCHAAYGGLKIGTAGFTQPLSCGLLKLRLSVKPPATICQSACGTPALTFTGVVSPSGVAEVIVYGLPGLKYRQVLYPPSVTVPLSAGIPVISTVKLIGPPGITLIIIGGSPAVLKYVWHVVLGGSYAAETPDINRVCVIGRDDDGNSVFGTAEDTVESELVGERLDFRQEPAVATADGAAELAASAVNKMRLNKASGMIVVPPNCGQELWDVVQVWDLAANQTGTRFRVIGIKFDYFPAKACFQQRLILRKP